MKINIKVITNKLSGNQKELLEMIFRNLSRELEYYYKYFSKNDKKFPIEEVFEYNERAYIGLLNNAIIRSDKNFDYYTLQEYCVKNNRIRKRGRADFLLLDVIHKEYYLFETKQRYTTETADIKSEKEDINGTEKYLNEILDQAKEYIVADNEFFKGKKVYSCALVFDSVDLNNSSTVEEYLEIPDYNQIHNYSYASFYMENINRVLNVYGRIEKYQSSK